MDLLLKSMLLFHEETNKESEDEDGVLEMELVAVHLQEKQHLCLLIRLPQRRKIP